MFVLRDHRPAPSYNCEFDAEVVAHRDAQQGRARVVEQALLPEQVRDPHQEDLCNITTPKSVLIFCTSSSRRRSTSEERFFVCIFFFFFPVVMVVRYTSFLSSGFPGGFIC